MPAIVVNIERWDVWMSKKINYEFKTLLGLAMLFVICEHTGKNQLFNFMGLFEYDSFQIALFIFISGYFFKDVYITDKTKEFIIKKIKRLFLPFCIWNLFYGCVITYLRHSGYWQFNMGSDLSLQSYFGKLFTLGTAYELNSPGWFLIHLFYVDMAYIIIRKLLHACRIRNDIVQFVLFTGISVVGMKLSQSYNTVSIIPISRVMFCLLWFELGHLYHKYIEEFLEKYHFWNNKCLIIIVCFAVEYLLKRLAGYGSLESPVFAARFSYNPLFTIIVALNAIILWMAIAKLISPIWTQSKVCRYISDHTFSLMMHHIFIGRMVMGLLYTFGYRMGRLPSFDEVLFRQNIWYFYLPDGQTYFLIAYMVIAVSVILSLIYLWERGMSKLKQYLIDKDSRWMKLFI